MLSRGRSVGFFNFLMNHHRKQHCVASCSIINDQTNRYYSKSKKKNRDEPLPLSSARPTPSVQGSDLTEEPVVENIKSNDSNYKSHVPVLVRQCCALLEGTSLIDKSSSKTTKRDISLVSRGKKSGINNQKKQQQQLFIDATFGAGGYTREILRTYPDCKVIGIDTDYYNNPTIQENEKLIHEEFGKDRLEVHCVNFRDIKKLVQDKIVPQLLSLKSEPAVVDTGSSNVIDGIVFDLGVSSMQLDQGHRGFSFLRDGPLDMRMNPLDDECPTAKDAVNNMSELDLRMMIAKFGEDEKAYRIAKAIVDYRNNVKPFETTLELANLIEKITPFHERKKKRIHPATKTFQAIRIFVNDELGALQNALQASKDVLKIGTGRLVVVSYHSLEDRITKDFMKDNQDCFKKITKGTIIPDDAEVEFNVRSRSAKLRCAQRIAESEETI